MKLVVGLLIVSLLMEYNEIKSIWAVLPFLLFAIGMLVYMGKNNGHRIKHPSGLPNPFFKGFFLSTVLACFLSFYINLLLRPIFREDGHFKSSLIFCMFLHVCMAKATKEVLTAHPFKLPQSTTSEKPNAALQRIIDQEAHSSNYCHQLRIILPPKAKYCKLTNAAYLDFDHHCLFLQRTIARGNHRLFVIFIGTMVLNQLGYIYALCTVDRETPWTAFEMLCTILCSGGAASMCLMLHLNFQTIGRGGTQYFPAMHQKWRLSNLIYFFKENQIKEPEGAYII